MPIITDCLNDILKDAVSKIKVPVKPEPSLMYHYTNASGLIGILSSASLWASDNRYLNDKQEFLHGTETFRRRISLVIDEAPDSPGAAMLKDALLYFDDDLRSITPRLFTTSFSDKPDLLNQWRVYGRGQGSFCIGFSTQYLKIWSEDVRYYLMPVEYNLETQITVANTIVRYFADFYETKSNDASLDADYYRMACCRALSELSLLYRASFKHPSFADEKEWRAILPSESEDNHDIKIRTGTFSLIPYIAHKPRLHQNIEPFKLPIEEIRIGPTDYPDIAEVALYDCLVRYNDRHIKICHSNIPIRF